MAENAIEIQEKPTLFSGAMVRAVIEGRKTQTRRVVKPQPELVDGRGKWRVRGDGSWPILDRKQLNEYLIASCPYGKPGDRLWVRETWCIGGNPTRVCYRASEGSDADCWKPSIHMPRAYSRLTLEIVSVKVERVQEISFQDCLAEGVIWTEHWDKVKGADIERYAAKHPKEWTVDESINQSWEDYTRLAFQGLWDSINDKRGFDWKENPWVWAIEFKVLAAGERRA